MNRAVTFAALGLALAGAPSTATAIPRFAARTGAECVLCHVSPTGGGIRSAYGRNVFQKVWLPMNREEPSSWIDAPGPDEEGAEPGEASTSSFSGEINEHMVLGADARAAYIYVHPDRPLSDGAELPTTSSFFLMQADLYHAAELGEHVSLVIDVGIYAGFEAWGLFRVEPDGSDVNLLIKAGRFMPAFGIRDVDHQLFTREGIGLGAADRDSGVEATLFLGPLTLTTALLNGTLGDTPFDVTGTDRRTFEKAAAARLAVRGGLGPLLLQLGGSFYFNHAFNQANPLFTGSLPSALAGELSAGLDELRVNVFLTASLGRFTYLADVTLVRDVPYRDVPDLVGYASYQELSLLAVQGLDVIATMEHRDPELDVAGNSSLRAGFFLELYPWAHTELRAGFRRTFGDGAALGGAWDVTLFSHLFF